MKTRTRASRRRSPPSSLGSQTPAPVSTELPDDDFDPHRRGGCPRGGSRRRRWAGDSIPTRTRSRMTTRACSSPRRRKGRRPARVSSVCAPASPSTTASTSKSSSRRAMEGAWARGRRRAVDIDAALEDASEDVSEDSDGRSGTRFPTKRTTTTRPKRVRKRNTIRMTNPIRSARPCPALPRLVRREKNLRLAFETSALEAEQRRCAPRRSGGEPGQYRRVLSQNAAKGAAVRTQNACKLQHARGKIFIFDFGGEDAHPTTRMHSRQTRRWLPHSPPRRRLRAARWARCFRHRRKWTPTRGRRGARFRTVHSAGDGRSVRRKTREEKEDGVPAHGKNMIPSAGSPRQLGAICGCFRSKPWCRSATAFRPAAQSAGDLREDERRLSGSARAVAAARVRPGFVGAGSRGDDAAGPAGEPLAVTCSRRNG